MDKEHRELQLSLGFFGILKESFKIIFSCRKTFSQITLILILALSLIAPIQLFDLLILRKHSSDCPKQTSYLKCIQDNCKAINDSSQSYVSLACTQEKCPTQTDFSDLLKCIEPSLSHKIISSLLHFISSTLLLIVTVFTTSAVAYAVAGIQISEPITFKKVKTAVPNVWKRLKLTNKCSSAIISLYNMIFAAGVIILLVVNNHVEHASSAILAMLVLLSILFCIGLFYIAIFSHLATVVSVLEEIYGMKAMAKSKKLIKGKIGVTVALLIMWGICLLIIVILLEVYVLKDRKLALALRIGIGILCFLLLSVLIIFGLVNQTVLYFVCKSHHQENIDTSSLAAHLETYLGEGTSEAADYAMDQIQSVITN
ncbi:hypothetical protein P3X46_024419 [Hevea brasiliensis]|uniref:Uncharacterized protein n=1 Tax=Hevea brasiliensis TaxID=3981 RepID=A0ABQ9L2E9_HEVBR|nr:uncharacterized protein LOC110649129 [Hevea brasiliensis]KAJ9158875.1 hypothetical protein P3X46_024419 [Hevea brasiliensis]